MGNAFEQPPTSEELWNDLASVLQDDEEREAHALIRKVLDLIAADRDIIDHALNMKGLAPRAFAAPKNSQKIELLVDELQDAKNLEEKQRVAQMIAEEI